MARTSLFKILNWKRYTGYRMRGGEEMEIEQVELKSGPYTSKQAQRAVRSMAVWSCKKICDGREGKFRLDVDPILQECGEVT